MKNKRILLAVLAIILTTVLSLIVFVACNGDPSAPADGDNHQHTFSQDWTSDETYHWHQATCGHTRVMGDKAEHTFGSDGKCSVCNGYGTQGVKYVCYGNRSIVSGFEDSMASDIVILDNYRGCPVTAIDTNAFFQCGELMSISIPSTVTSIGSYAFAECSSLTEIIIPNSVTSIGLYAFDRCSSLTEIIIPSGVTSIGERAFYECANLQTVTFESDSQLQSIGAAFYGCSSLHYNTADGVNYLGNDENQYFVLIGVSDRTQTTYIIQPTTEIICNSAFADCSNLTEITIPASVTSIGDRAFEGCSNLQMVTFEHGSQLQSIGNQAFDYCSSLKEITIPSSVTSIDSSAFDGCNNLHYFTVNGVKYLGNDENNYLVLIGVSDKTRTSYTIQDTTKFICAAAFFGCSSLTEITIPSGITSIGRSAFYGCSNLQTITFDGDSQLKSIGGSAFYECRNLKEITIPASVTSIGDKSFYNCDSLTEITIPSTLTSIGTDAFDRCVNLEKIYYYGTIADWCNISFGSNPMGYGQHFYLRQGGSWQEVTEITIPEGVTEIGDFAFFNSNVTSVTIPSTVVSISQDAFFGVDNASVYYNGTIADWCNISFANQYSNPMCCSVYYSSFYMKQGGSWQMITEIKIPEGVTEISNYTFCGFKVTSFTIPSTVTSIGESAFYGCSSLKEIAIPTSVTRIDDTAFFGCGSLHTVTFERGSQLQSIGNQAFDYCQSLKEITIPASVTSIGGGAFGSCTSLQTVTFDGDSQLQSIGSAAFTYGDSLTEITIPASVTSIGDYAFSNCDWLRTITFEGDSQLHSIGKGAFYKCRNLKEITIPASVTSIGSGAFSGCNSFHNYHTYTDDGIDYLGDVENKYLVLIGASDKSRTSYTIQNTTKIISGDAFSNCSNLTEITIPSTVTSIGNSAFYGCTNLQMVIFDGNSQLQCIDEEAFYNCSNLTEITIPSTVTSLGDNAFYGCTNLQTVIFDGNSQLQIIGKEAFYKCHNLKEITIPSAVASIDDSAFSDCSQLTTVYWNATNCIKAGRENYYYTIFADCSELSKVVIGENVQAIPSYAFSDCISLQTVIFDGDSQLQSIGEKSFYNCDSLTEITIPSTVTSIGERAFSTNITSSGLQMITFEHDSQLQSIGRSAFAGCSNLTEITIPASVTSIGWWAFDGCSSLQTVTFENPNGWKAGYNSLVLTVPAQNVVYLTKTYYGYTWTRS